MGSRAIKFLVILLLQTSISGCMNEVKTVKPELPGEEITFLSLGDSYTIGESVAENERWPVQLADSLRGEGFRIDDPVIVARTGWTTGELIDGIDKAGLSGPYDLVSLLIGVNNQYRGGDPEIFRKEFVELLGISISLAGNNEGKVFVLTIPDWGVTPFANGRDNASISREIDIFNTIVTEESLNAGIQCFDITDISRRASHDTTLVARDGLHPSGEMYSQWVERIMHDIITIISTGA